jgi:hypothetical protein
MFTDKEVAYRKGQRIGRPATANSTGHRHVIPTEFNIDADKGLSGNRRAQPS